MAHELEAVPEALVDRMCPDCGYPINLNCWAFVQEEVRLARRWQAEGATLSPWHLRLIAEWDALVPA